MKAKSESTLDSLFAFSSLINIIRTMNFEQFIKKEKNSNRFALFLIPLTAPVKALFNNPLASTSIIPMIEFVSHKGFYTIPAPV